MSDMFGTTPEDDDPTRDELYERAQELDIDGRSSMDKDELEAAVAEAEGSEPTTGETTGNADRDRTEDAISAAPTPRAAPSEDVEDDEGDTPRTVNPSYESDDEGYVGVAPEYANASTSHRAPQPEEGSDEDE